MGGPILVPMPVHHIRVFGPVPDSLAEHSGDDTLGRAFEELPGKTAADAVTHVEELADAEMVHQPQLVGGEGVPRVVDRNRAAGFAAVRVALVHRDAMEVVLEDLHRIEHGGRPIADPRVQAAAGGDQQWEAGAGLLVADANVASFVERHGNSSLPNMVPRMRASLSTARALRDVKPNPQNFPKLFDSTGFDPSRRTTLRFAANRSGCDRI